MSPPLLHQWWQCVTTTTTTTAPPHQWWWWCNSGTTYATKMMMTMKMHHHHAPMSTMTTRCVLAIPPLQRDALILVLNGPSFTTTTMSTCMMTQPHATTMMSVYSVMMHPHPLSCPLLHCPCPRPPCTTTMTHSCPPCLFILTLTP